MKIPREINTLIVGASYEVPTYMVQDGKIIDGKGLTVTFCTGNIDPTVVRHEGVFPEDLVEMAIQHLTAVNTGHLASRETSLAITNLEEAGMWLEEKGNEMFFLGKEVECDVLDVGAKYKIPTYQATDDEVVKKYGLTIPFCKGSISDPNVFRQEGVFVESIIALTIKYLKTSNEYLASQEISEAITKLRVANMWLGKRAKNRKNRGVQGTYEK